MISELNADQQRAVESAHLTTVVIAGPGTGKTKTLVHRIDFLSRERRINADHILALTFTRKAAREIESRLSERLGYPPTSVHTFHSLAMEILREHGQTELKIISDRKRRKIINQHRGRLSYNEATALISSHKSGQATKDSSEFVNLYNQQLHEFGFCDYDDLLLNALHALQESVKLKETLQNRFQQILIDEFQDTNLIQYQLVRQLRGLETGLYVIGDPRQSIYGFRGANEKIFQTLVQDFPESEMINLQINYRSGRRILEASQRLFSNESHLIPAVSIEGTVNLIETLDEKTEANFILTFIEESMGGMDLLKASDLSYREAPKISFNDFAIIYRTHGFAHLLKKKFAESGIPFQSIGEETFFNEEGMANVLTGLKYYLEPNEKFLEEMDDLQKSQLLEWVHSHSTDSESRASTRVGSLIEVFGLRDKFSKSPTKLVELNEFCNGLLRFDSQSEGLSRLVDYWQYLTENEYYDESADRVTLMTMHAAKGLEFNHVFVCGLEDGLIPFTAKGESDLIVDEERRLLFVAMTRARVGLYLLRARRRNRINKIPSRFLVELRQGNIEEMVDPTLEKELEKRRHWKVKKSQGSLF